MTPEEFDDAKSPLRREWAKIGADEHLTFGLCLIGYTEASLAILHDIKPHGLVIGVIAERPDDPPESAAFIPASSISYLTWANGHHD